MSEVVIFLPGIMGSELWNGGQMIWPGAVSELLFPYDKMKQLLDPNTTVGDIIRSVSLSSQYDSLIDAFATCGFREGDQSPTLAVCPYDWRKDNALAAEVLAAKVIEMHGLHGSDLVLNLVAHSMGGLVCRYFLESGQFSEVNCPGFANVRRLVTIGTPHRGAPLALHAAIGQIKRLFLNAKQVKEVASDPNFPALYQLMPPPSEPFMWNANSSSRLEPKSPHDADIAERFELSAHNLASAAAFHGLLGVHKRPSTVDYFCCVGTRQETISNVRFDFESASGVLPNPTETKDGGDGTVPSWSASLPEMQQLLVGGDHGSLYKTNEVLVALGALLGKAGVLASMQAANLVRISVREEVVLPQQSQPIVLFFFGQSQLDAELVVRKLTDEDGKKLDEPTAVAKWPVRYVGPVIDSMSVEVKTPRYPGTYELDLVADGASIAERRVPFFVQNFS